MRIGGFVKARRPLGVVVAGAAFVLGLGLVPVPGIAPVPSASADSPDFCDPTLNSTWRIDLPYSTNDGYSRNAPGTNIDSGLPKGSNEFGDPRPTESVLEDPDFAGLDVAAPGVLWNDFVDTVDVHEPAYEVPTGSAILVRAPAHAKSFTLRADGSFRYVPEDGYFFSDSFDYVFALDGTSCSSTATVRIPTTGRPYPAANRYTLYGGETLTFAGLPCGYYCGVLDLDRNLPAPIPGFIDAWITGASNDTGSRALAWFDAGKTFPLHLGTLTDFNRDGTFTYVPNPGATGVETFQYGMTRNLYEGKEYRATVTIELKPVVPVQQPLGADDVVNGTEGTPIVMSGTTLRANDPRANYITNVGTNLFRATTWDTYGGSLSIAYGEIFNDGVGDDKFASTLTYTPDPDFYGVDSFTYWVATNYPWNTSPVPVTVRLNVANVPDTPIVGQDAAQAQEDQPITINLVANDSDGDGDLNLGSMIEVPQCPSGCANGQWTLHGDGTVTYVPAHDFVGLASFRYRIYDHAGHFGEASVYVNVNADDAVDDHYTALEDTPLTVQYPDTTFNDDPMALSATPAVVLWSNPSHGTLNFANNWGAFTYSPAPGYIGTDSFTYRYQNDEQTQFSDLATVTIDVQAVNDAPTLVVPTLCLPGELCLGGKQLRDVAEGGNPITVSGFIKDVEFNSGTLTIAWGDGLTTSANYPCTAPCAFGTTSTFTETVPCIGCIDRQYFAFTHSYHDDPTSGDDRYNITVTANDGASTSVGTQARVRNVNPTLTVAQPSLIGYPLVPITVSGNVSDPVDPTSVSVNWGDGSVATAATLNCLVLFQPCTYSAQHTYTAGGQFTATITASDGDGGTDVETRTVSIITPTDDQISVLPPTLDVPDTTPEPGDQFTIQQGGFTPGETVLAMIQSTPQVLAAATANGLGVVSLDVTIPNDLAVGDHTLSVFGVTSHLGAKALVEVVDGIPGFSALVPVRVFDTRPSEAQGVVPVVQQPYGGGSVLRVKVTGVAGVPASGVGAVSLNVTAVSPVGAGFVTVFPCGDRPLASNLNYVAGQVVPNAVIAPVSAAGEVCFYSLVDTHLIADVNGWFAAGSDFSALVPVRVFDTRPSEAQGVVPVVQQPYGGGSVLRVKVTGVAGVPASGVGAVSLNVTAVSPVGAGFVTVFPCGDRPLASNLNYVAGQVVPNAVIAPVSAAGEVCFYSLVDTHLIADVNGWFAAGSDFSALVPVRVFDTRPSEAQGVVPVVQQPYGGGSVLRVKVTGVAGVPASGVGAVSLNVTAVSPVGAGFVTVFPCGDRPLASNLNYVAGQVVPNAVIAPVSAAGEVCFYSLVDTHLIADVNGWFAGTS